MCAVCSLCRCCLVGLRVISRMPGPPAAAAGLAGLAFFLSGFTKSASVLGPSSAATCRGAAAVAAEGQPCQQPAHRRSARSSSAARSGGSSGRTVARPPQAPWEARPAHLSLQLGLQRRHVSPLDGAAGGAHLAQQDVQVAVVAAAGRRQARRHTISNGRERSDGAAAPAVRRSRHAALPTLLPTLCALLQECTILGGLSTLRCSPLLLQLLFVLLDARRHRLLHLLRRHLHAHARRLLKVLGINGLRADLQGGAIQGGCGAFEREWTDARSPPTYACLLALLACWLACMPHSCVCFFRLRRCCTINRCRRRTLPDIQTAHPAAHGCPALLRGAFSNSATLLLPDQSSQRCCCTSTAASAAPCPNTRARHPAARCF